MPRVDRLLARNLSMGRRLATRLFRSGRVTTPDGTPLRDPAHPIKPSELPCEILIDGQVEVLHTRYHILQNKPIGVVTALRDGRHPTVRELLEDIPLLGELRPVGRLDLDVSGLLLWTTEGDLLHRLTHPRYAVPRVYQAALRAPYAPLPADAPLLLDDGYEPAILGLHALDRADAHPSLRIPEETQCLATLTVASGQFHEVKRIFAALGSEVIGLCRVAYGSVELPRDLPLGGHRPLDLHAIFADLHPTGRVVKKKKTSPNSPSPG